MPTKLKKLALRGWRSIVDTGEPGIEIGDLNVLLGANGAGKSNLLAFFALLNASMEGRLNTFVGQELGGASAQLAGGPRRTPVVVAKISFEGDSGSDEYGFTLAHAADDRFLFTDEHCGHRAPDQERSILVPLGAGHFESAMRAASQQEGPDGATARFIRATLLGWRFFHFHDTSARAAVKLGGAASDNLYLRADASNLAAFLLKLREESPGSYKLIRATVGLAAPFFEDFVLEPEGPGGGMIRLRWRQKGDDVAYGAHQLSDGTLRLMCLAALLLQPSLPSLIVIDEPELGLHPYAIELLATLLRQASEKAQVVISTQSVPLVDALASPDELIVVDRQTGASRFRRIDGEALREWLEDYTLGQLWVKNLLGGGPRS
ncbi:MAG: AAA family ATPase [Byssovorax sp.]